MLMSGHFFFQTTTSPHALRAKTIQNWIKSKNMPSHQGLISGGLAFHTKILHHVVWCGTQFDEKFSKSIGFLKIQTIIDITVHGYVIGVFCFFQEEESSSENNQTRPIEIKGHLFAPRLRSQPSLASK